MFKKQQRKQFSQKFSLTAVKNKKTIFRKQEKGRVHIVHEGDAMEHGNVLLSTPDLGSVPGVP